DLAPEDMLIFRIERPVFGGGANSLEHDARNRQLFHQSRPLGDHPIEYPADAELRAAIAQHLHVKGKASVSIPIVERRFDLRLGSDTYDVARAETQGHRWRGRHRRQEHAGVSDSLTLVLHSIEQAEGGTFDERLKMHVARHPVADEMTGVAPCDGL